MIMKQVKKILYENFLIIEREKRNGFLIPGRERYYTIKKSIKVIFSKHESSITVDKIIFKEMAPEEVKSFAKRIHASLDADYYN